MRAPLDIRPMLVAAIALSFFACVDRGGPTSPADSPAASDDVTIAVRLPASSVEVGYDLTAAATATNSAGEPVQIDSIEWSSSDTSVVLISNTGLVNAKKSGAAHIYAKWHKRSGRGTLAVTDTVPSKVIVAPATASEAVGSHVQLTAAVTTRTGKPLPAHAVKWSSTNASVVSVSSDGIVTGLKPGSAQVIAQASNVADSASVSIGAASINALAVSPATSTIASGQTTQLSARATDAAGNQLTGRAVAWSTSDESVASVSTGGVVTGGKVGDATITATAEGVRATAAIHVGVGSAKTVTITPGSIGLVAGKTQQLAASLEDDAGNALAAQGITWSTSNSGIATISSTGLVTGVHAGSATITAAAGGSTGSATVVVSAGAIKTITITPTSLSLVAGSTRQLAVSLLDVAGNTLTGQAVSWSSSNSSVATVSSSGLVSATHAGNATITAAAGGASVSASLTVTAGSISTISLTPGSASLVAGGTQQLTAKLMDGSGNTITGQAVTWSTSNAGVATVSSAGLATAVKTGTATITASASGKSATATIAVAAGAVNSISITPASGAVQQGKTLQLSATFFDVSGNTVTGTSVTWTSASPSVAAVSGTGIVTGVAVGSTSITVASNGKSKSAAITVIALPKATLSSLALNPNSVSLAAGATQRFSVSGTWSDGSSTTPTVTYSATGGTITSAGVYTAGNSAGSFRVVAVEQGGTTADSSVVTIAVPASAPPTLTRVTISPASVTLAPNGTAQFKTSATWSDGSTTSPAVSYSASGGSISSSGLYTAGSTGGSFRVIAADAGYADTSIVTVTSPVSQGASCSNPQGVSTISQLTSALSQARPGDCILLAAGTYTLGAGLTIANSGTASSPIVVEGAGSNSVINVNQHSLFIDASYLHLRKVRLTNFSTVGLWLRGATGDVLDSIEVDHTQQEAIAVKNGSNHNVLKNSLIHDTGLSNGQYAEGIYIGNSGESAPLDFGVTDNQIVDNHFGPNVRAEAIDLKEGADRTVISGNYIDGTGAFYYSGTGTLVAVKSSGVLIDSNYMQVGMQQAVAFEAPVASVMSGNVASRNRIDLRTSGYGFQFQAGTVSPMGAIIKCDNVMISGQLSNRSCTP